MSLQFLIFLVLLLSPLDKRRALSFEQTINSIHPRMLYAKFVLNIGLVVIENLRFILKYCVRPCVISLLNMYLPYRKWLGHTFEKNWIPFIQVCFVSSLKLDPCRNLRTGGVVPARYSFWGLKIAFMPLYTYPMLLLWK